MSFVTTTCEKRTDAVLDSYDLETESRPKEGSTTDEEYRAVLRVIVSIELQNVTDMSRPTSSLCTATSFSVRFNRDVAVTLEPLSAQTTGTVYPFHLMSQSYTPFEMKGSTFFRATQEYLSVTPWEALTW